MVLTWLLGDALARNAIAKAEKNALCRYGHTLFAPDELLHACGGKMPGSYGSLVKGAERLAVAPEISAPAVIKTPVDLWLHEAHSVPSMQSLGLTRQTTPFPGGETEGLARLQRFYTKHLSPWMTPRLCLTRPQIHRPGVMGGLV